VRTTLAAARPGTTFTDGGLLIEMPSPTTAPLALELSGDVDYEVLFRHGRTTVDHAALDFESRETERARGTVVSSTRYDRVLIQATSRPRRRAQYVLFAIRPD
jgi:hypothetical protein